MDNKMFNMKNECFAVEKGGDTNREGIFGSGVSSSN